MLDIALGLCVSGLVMIAILVPIAVVNLSIGDRRKNFNKRFKRHGKIIVGISIGCSLVMLGLCIAAVELLSSFLT